MIAYILRTKWFGDGVQHMIFLGGFSPGKFVVNEMVLQPKTFFPNRKYSPRNRESHTFIILLLFNRGGDFTMLNILAPSRLRSGVPLRY